MWEDTQQKQGREIKSHEITKGHLSLSFLKYNETFLT
jgi:hypothetical protein